MIEQRMKMKRYEPKKAHEIVDTIQKRLTAEERDFWWRLTHKLISTKKTESKWRRHPNGELVESTCPVCKEEEEDREHYEYGCKEMEKLRRRIAERIGRENGQISREEWGLEVEGMETETAITIAKVRWIYHCVRCSIDNGKKKRMNIDLVIQKLDRRLTVLNTIDVEASKKKTAEASKKAAVQLQK